MSDAPARPVAPNDAPQYSLTVEQTAERYEQAGVSRTIRRIQKYCARGDLDCKKVETEFGERYLITVELIDRHIAQISDALAAAGRAPARPGAPERPPQQEAIPEETKVPPPDAPSRPGAPDERYLTQLEKRIDEKDGEIIFLRSELTIKNQQITALSENAKQSTATLGALQRLMAPLLGSPDPFRRPSPEGEEKDS